MDNRDIEIALEEAMALAQENFEGYVVSYISELASVPPNQTSAAVYLNNGTRLLSGNVDDHILTMQSVAKLIPLIGLLEEFGSDKVLSWINVEPSGQSYASLARLDGLGPTPSNPMVNAGAIILCDRISGDIQTKLDWLDMWIEKLFNQKLSINLSVYNSEKKTGDRNRALTYLMKSTGVVNGEVEEILQLYFALCSYNTSVKQASHFAMLLANNGLNTNGDRILTIETVNHIVALMATCGLYDESGIHLWHTGMPSKSGVSGLILAVAVGKAGIAVASPRINSKGTSIRGEIILRHLSNKLDWHFAQKNH